MSALPGQQHPLPTSRVLSQASIRLVPEPIRVGLRTQSQHPHEPEINVTRRGDRVQQIEVRCGCGEVILIDCEY